MKAKQGFLTCLVFSFYSKNWRLPLPAEGLELGSLGWFLNLCLSVRDGDTRGLGSELGA